MDAIAPGDRIGALWQGVAAALAALVDERQAHPSRTVVLLPYAQLMPIARSAWARLRPDGFAPRFETTRNWASAGTFEPGEADIAFDRGRDLLTARSLLSRVGFDHRAESLAPRVVEAAVQLAPLAAAVAPADRAGWAVRARAAVSSGMDAPLLQLEAAVARLAVEWAAASSYVTDDLLEGGPVDALDLLVVVEGLQSDPLESALLARAGDRGCTVPFGLAGDRGDVQLHPCAGASDEAERAAACVLRHVASGRVPVALAATDRVLTRRIAALLQGSGIVMRDEQGWKLSTTRSAAQVMTLLRACAWDAASDLVIDWLKHAPAAGTGSVLGLERKVRRGGIREWRMLRESDCGQSEALLALLQKSNRWRESMSAPRTLPQWLLALASVLEETGQLARLRQDEAGVQVLDALRLASDGAGDIESHAGAGLRMDLGAFRSWVDEVLEADSFRRSPRASAPVVILPFEAMLGRSFAAVVMPGCDEQTLPASPEPQGEWTTAQRRELGMPSREELQASRSAAWEQALQVPHVDVLWRTGDDHGETLLASPLVQSLVLEGVPYGEDPRGQRELDPVPETHPQPQARASEDQQFNLLIVRTKLSCFTY